MNISVIYTTSGQHLANKGTSRPYYEERVQQILFLLSGSLQSNLNTTMDTHRQERSYSG